MFVVVDPVARVRPARYTLGDGRRGNLVVVLLLPVPIPTDPLHPVPLGLVRRTGQRRRVPLRADLSLDVLADAPEAPDVARDEGERDRKQHIVHVALLADRVDVHLDADVPLEHGRTGATALVLHAERHRRKDAVRQLGHRQKGMDEMSFDRRQGFPLDEYGKSFVLFRGHQVTEPGLFRQLG